MKNTMKLTIVTPDKNFFTGEVLEVLTETTKGEIGVLPNHAPLVASLKPTVTKIKTADGVQKIAFTSNGVLKIEKNEVKLLCDACEWSEEIDKERAHKAEERAKERLKQKDAVDMERARLGLLRSVARIKAADIR